MAKAKIHWNLPLQIGYFVYQNAKLRMLQFYYDCILNYINAEDFQLCEMDTDSLYFVISDSSLENIVKIGKKAEFYNSFHNWFPSPACDEHHTDFVQTKCRGEIWEPRGPCCIQRLKDDKRTPGLFKLEYEGDGIVALCSKTYFCFTNNYNGEETNTKVATKGLSKNLNHLTKQKYLQVLESKTSGSGINRGFRSDGKTVFTYEQERASLSYLYIKRKVCDDGISTEPLDL